MSSLNKKGQASTARTLYVIIGLILALAVSVSFVIKIVDDVNGKTFEKNYIAREIALSLDAIYSSPGTIEYDYSMRGYNFVVEIIDSGVIVKKSAAEANAGSGYYDYYDGLGSSPNDMRLHCRITPDPGVSASNPMAITFKKDPKSFSIEVKNGVANDYANTHLSCNKQAV